MSENNKITWQKVLQAIIQAAIAALTALGITSCTTAYDRGILPPVHRR